MHSEMSLQLEGQAQGPRRELCLLSLDVYTPMKRLPCTGNMDRVVPLGCLISGLSAILRVCRPFIFWVVSVDDHNSVVPIP
jgi:hypothetical protein